MPNPFACLNPALAALTQSGKVLPATGQAVIDLMTPDIDETVDRITTDKADRHVEKIIETPPWRVYHEVGKINRQENHIFRYFADGSTKTYFLGTVVEHDRSSPVQLAQVGAAAVFRENDGSLKRATTLRKIVLMLSKADVSPALWQAVEISISGIHELELRDSGEKDPITDGIQAREPRLRGAHKANWAMRELELKLAKEALRSRSDSEWLVLDGGLGNEFLTWDGPPLIGVAKSFSREPTFKVGSGPAGKVLNLYELLAGLKTGCRTCAFGARSSKIAFWYVRIREQRGLDYPLMGVVKVEYPNPSGEPVPSDLINLISGALVAERSVTPHGRDPRWHAHLYPISIAEMVVKGLFYSAETLKAAIKWPQSISGV